MEYDDVALLQILLTDAQHGVPAVQRIHPAGVLAVGELANGHIAVGHALDVVAGGVIPCYAGQLLQRVPHSHVGGHFHLVAADPRGQAALGQSVYLAVVAVGLVAQQGDGHGNVLRLFIQHGDDDLYLSRAVLERHRLLAVLAAVVAGDLEVNLCGMGIGLAHCPVGRNGRASQVKFITNIILSLSSTDFQLVAHRRANIVHRFGQFLNILA